MLVAGKGHEALPDHRHREEALRRRGRGPRRSGQGRRRLSRRRWARLHASADQEILDATGARFARATGRARSTGVTTDTRTLAAGLPLRRAAGRALRRPRFLPEAASAGAQRARWSGQAIRGPRLPEGWPLFEVADTLVALGALARFHRRRFTDPRRRGGRQQRQDHHQGDGGGHPRRPRSGAEDRGQPQQRDRRAAHPASGSSRAHVAAVVEMGMNHPGEMARLTRDCRARRAAVITVVQPEHLEGLGSLEGVAAGRGRALRRPGPERHRGGQPRRPAHRRAGGTRQRAAGSPSARDRSRGGAARSTSTRSRRGAASRWRLRHAGQRLAGAARLRRATTTR